MQIWKYKTFLTLLVYYLEYVKQDNRLMFNKV